MSPLPNEKGEKDETLFKRPAGVLLDEKQWLYLRKRYHMTTRELQVAILVCRGFNNEEIGKALKIRHGTVKTHLRNIYRRVRVKSKVTLLLKFIEDVNKFYEAEKGTEAPIRIEEKPGKPTAPIIPKVTQEK